MEKFSKMDALTYLAENRTDCNEWSGAGMAECLIEVILSEKKKFSKEYLDTLLENASNY